MFWWIVAISVWSGDKRSAQQSNASSTVAPLQLCSAAACSVATLVLGLLLLLQGFLIRTVACHKHAELQFLLSNPVQQFHWPAKKGPLEYFCIDCRAKMLSCVPECPVSSKQKLSLLSATTVIRGGKRHYWAPCPCSWGSKQQLKWWQRDYQPRMAKVPQSSPAAA